jgi:hypothetical protein
MVVYYEHHNKSDSIKDVEFLDQLSDYLLLKEDVHTKNNNYHKNNNSTDTAIIIILYLYNIIPHLKKWKKVCYHSSVPHFCVEN